MRTSSPVEFAHDYLFPSPEAHDTVSFELDDVLFTAASRNFLRNLRRQGQTVQMFLPAFNTLSSLRSVTPTPRGLVCRKSPSTSASFSVAFGRRTRLPPPSTRSFAASDPRDRRHSRFSSTTYGPLAGHFSVQCFALYHPEQGRQWLSFVVENVASSRPSRHPNTGMSSTSLHSASSIVFLSRMEVSTRGIALGSPHNSVRLHTSVWPKPPLASTGFTWQ